MHITFWPMIEPGDVYFVAFPKWSNTFEKTNNPTDYWHRTKCWKILGDLNQFSDKERLYKGWEVIDNVEKIPLGSRALVLKKAGEGIEAKTFAKWFDLVAERFVLCWFTNCDTDDSFLAVIGVTELYEQDPREEFP